MVTLSPVGLATAPVANSVSLLATYKEKLCHFVSAIATQQPQATVELSYGTPVLNGTTVFVPITASITLVSPKCGSCCATTQVIKETFEVAFQGQTALPTAVTVTSEGIVQGLIKICNNKSNTYAINQSLIVSITPATTAA